MPLDKDIQYWELGDRARMTVREKIEQHNAGGLDKRVRCEHCGEVLDLAKHPVQDTENNWFCNATCAEAYWQEKEG